MAKYIAQFETSEQFTEDSWKVIHPSIEVTDQTTIGDIRRWIDNDRRSPRINEFRVIMLDSQASKPENK